MSESEALTRELRGGEWGPDSEGGVVRTSVRGLGGGHGRYSQVSHHSVTGVAMG